MNIGHPSPIWRGAGGEVSKPKAKKCQHSFVICYFYKKFEVMQQITFSVPNPDMVEKILLTLSKIGFISDIHVKSDDDTITDQIIPAKRTATSLDEMLADWTGMEEPTENFRKKLWKTKSF